MLRVARIYAWASCFACLAIAVAMTGAIADENQNEPQQYEALRPASEDSQSQDQQQIQQTQPSQQQGQRAQQRRGQQSHQQGQQLWNERSSRGEQGTLPGPGRDSFSREGQRGRGQWSRERGQYGRDEQWSSDQPWSQGSQRSGSDEKQAGLGVSIARGEFGDVVVIKVYGDSPADQMGIREGDRITHVNGREIQSPGQLISRIRNMQPGEEVELDVQRGNQEQTFRGARQSRREALVMRGAPIGEQYGWQQDRDNRQTGYEEERSSGGQSQSGRTSGVDRQISQIERQLSQLNRELDELRFAVQDLRQQTARSSRETTAGYDEYRDRDIQGTRTDGSRRTGRWQDEGQRQSRGSREFQSNERSEFGQRQGRSERGSGQYQSREFGQQSGQNQQGTRSHESAEDQTIGGEIGEERSQTGSEINDRN